MTLIILSIINSHRFYFNNTDWPGNNLKYWKPQTEEGKWRWILFDTDFGFGLDSVNEYQHDALENALESDGPYWPNPPWATLLFRKLMENQNFKFKFINRFADILNTTFTSTKVVGKIDSIAGIIKPEINQHSMRWNEPSPFEWDSAVNKIKIFARNRTMYVQEHICRHLSNGNIFNVNINNFALSGGFVKINSIEIKEDNWKGKYFENVPITITALPNPGFKFLGWDINGVHNNQETLNLELSSTTVIGVYFGR